MSQPFPALHVPLFFLSVCCFLALVAANESTNSRVVWFSILELVVMIAIGGYEIITLRRFFEQKGRV